MATAVVDLEATAVEENKNLLPVEDEWEEFLQGRYKEGKTEEEFRQYDAEANPGVAEFYRLNHEFQTHDYVLGKEKQYFGLNRGMQAHPRVHRGYDDAAKVQRGVEPRVEHQLDRLLEDEEQYARGKVRRFFIFVPQLV